MVNFFHGYLVILGLLAFVLVVIVLCHRELDKQRRIK